MGRTSGIIRNLGLKSKRVHYSYLDMEQRFQNLTADKDFLDAKRKNGIINQRQKLGSFENKNLEVQRTMYKRISGIYMLLNALNNKQNQTKAERTI